MKLGIKVGPQKQSIDDLIAVRPDFCEVWFHVGQIDQYDNLFHTIHDIQCESGLHFWGALPGNIEVNLSYPDPTIVKASVQLIKHTIDYAAAKGCIYVNVHPGEARLTKIDFDKEIFEPIGPEAPLASCVRTLEASLRELASYAADKDILFYVESVPPSAPGTPWHGPEGRKHPVDIVQIPVSEVAKMLTIDNVYFTNDLGHTAANIITTDPTMVFDFLWRTTTNLRLKTKLIHASYLIPPYNGTDYHGCLYYEEFNLPGAVSNRDQMKKLLQIFKDRQDVGVLVEPEKDHQKNFHELKKLVEELS